MRHAPSRYMVGCSAHVLRGHVAMGDVIQIKIKRNHERMIITIRAKADDLIRQAAALYAQADALKHE